MADCNLAFTMGLVVETDELPELAKRWRMAQGLTGTPEADCLDLKLLLRAKSVFEKGGQLARERDANLQRLQSLTPSNLDEILKIIVNVFRELNSIQLICVVADLAAASRLVKFGQKTPAADQRPHTMCVQEILQRVNMDARTSKTIAQVQMDFEFDQDRLRRSFSPQIYYLKDAKRDPYSRYESIPDTISFSDNDYSPGIQAADWAVATFSNCWERVSRHGKLPLLKEEERSVLRKLRRAQDGELKGYGIIAVPKTLPIDSVCSSLGDLLRAEE